MGITNLFLGRNLYYIIYYTILLYLHIHNTIIQENKTHSKNIYAIWFDHRDDRDDHSNQINVW